MLLNCINDVLVELIPVLVSLLSWLGFYFYLYERVFCPRGRKKGLAGLILSQKKNASYSDPPI